MDGQKTPRERALKNSTAERPKNPEANLCCPGGYPAEETSHIPREVIDRFYGCGSPISLAGITPGETVLDLGSGAGIDCFIAAKKTGREGKVIGIDMTDEMLEVANECKGAVSENLGYRNVEFRKGFLEEIPADTKSADLITSNCVINLSPNKRKVFSEMWRVAQRPREDRRIRYSFRPRDSGTSKKMTSGFWASASRARLPKIGSCPTWNRRVFTV